MNEKENIIYILKRELCFLKQKYGIKSLELFGSYLHDEYTSDSDLDLLVTFYEPPGLLSFLEVENYLSDKLGIKVDLVMKDSLKPGIAKQVLEEAQPI